MRDAVDTQVIVSCPTTSPDGSQHVESGLVGDRLEERVGCLGDGLMSDRLEGMSVKTKGRAAANLRSLARAYGNPSYSGEILPAIYTIEPTNDCNLNCVMCPNDKLGKRSYIDLDLFEKVVDEVKDVAKAIRLNFLGEPLLHPKIIDMIAFCKSTTAARVSMSTNATKLNEDLSRQIIDSGLDEITFSIDANSPGIYAKIRRGGDFSEVIANVEIFLTTLGTRTKPRAIVKLVKMNTNRRQVEGFKRRWSKYNCLVFITWLSTWAGQMDHLKRLSDTLSPKLNSSRTPCADVWYRMAVKSSGDVVLCCYDYAGTYPIGNVRNQSVAEIWNSDSVNFAREVHSFGDYNHLEMCNSCTEWSTRVEVSSLWSPGLSGTSCGRP